MHTHPITEKLNVEESDVVLKSAFKTYFTQSKDAGVLPEFRIIEGGNRLLKNHSLHEYDIVVDGKNQHWMVFDGEGMKVVVNSTDMDYIQIFDKTTGYNIRMGKDRDTDPEWCPLGPEIADIEVVTGSCPKVNSENCRWCYKNNTSAPGRVMTLDEFKKVVMSFPRNLSQVALGITGVKSNPYLTDMLKWLREYGVIGNLTLTGADLDDDMTDALCKYCGACAVSCYDKAKELCYSTINRLHDNAMKKFNRDMHINMHIVIADFSIDHVMSVLEDVKNGKVPGLKSIVMLHAKPVGRAKNMDCSLSKDNLTKVIKFCLENNISFGFDSCNGYNVQDILVEMGRSELCSSIEPCESARQSIYVNVEGKITPCSFVEHVYENEAIDLLKNDVKLIDEWVTNKMLHKFRTCTKCSKSCPVYSLDCK